MSLDAPPGSPLEWGGGTEVSAQTGSFDALGHVFAVSCGDAALAMHLEETFAALAVPGEPTGWYRVRGHGDRFGLTWRGENVVACTNGASVLASLHWDVNRRAVAAADTDLVLNAGCVVRDGRAIVVSGPPGCGKSTLAAALVAHRCDYLNDEAVPVDIARGQVRPFPRPLLLDDHSLDLLPEIPALRSAFSGGNHKRTVVIKPRPDLLEHQPLDVAMVLFPEREPSAVTQLRPMTRGDAIVRLAEHAFNFPNHQQDAINALTLMMQNADAYRVVGDDPRAATSAALDALAGTALRAAQHGEEERCHERRDVAS
jgi:hypothetical protein